MKISRTKIELLQAEQGMSSKELAERAGMCRQNVSIIKTRGTCTPVTAAKLARALGVDPAELIETEE